MIVSVSLVDTYMIAYRVLVVKNFFQVFATFFFCGLWLAFPLAVVYMIALLYLFVKNFFRIFIKKFCGAVFAYFIGGYAHADNRQTAESRQYFSVNAPGCITGQKITKSYKWVSSEQNSYQIDFRFRKTIKKDVVLSLRLLRIFKFCFQNQPFCKILAIAPL